MNADPIAPPLLEGAIEALSEGFALFDAADRLILSNAQFRARFPGMEALLEPGLPWSLFLHEARRRGAGDGLARLEAHLAQGAEGALSVEAERPGGRWSRVSLAHTPDGGFALTDTDLTEVRTAESMRAEADGLLRTVLDACVANIVLCRVGDGHIHYATPAWARLFGPRESVLAIYDDPAQRADLLTALLAEGSVDGFEATLLNAAGTPFPARISARLVDIGEETAVVSAIDDMTQLYAQRDALARRREAEWRTEKLAALGELLAGVSHELNNPLSVVVGQALMLREDLADPDAIRRADKIGAAAERCAKIVKTFLAMARQKPAALAAVSLNGMIQTALDVAGYGLKSAGATIDLRLDPADPVAWADEDQITQVLINLIVNAEHAMRGQGRAARLTVSTRRDAEAACVAVEISDTGPGVPDSLRARIFEPFFTTKQVGDGAGVGLALSHRILASHGGALEIDDAPGGGARFTATLPQARRPAVEAEENAQAPASAKSVLIVEDEPEVAETIAAILSRDGVAARHAESGQAALKLLEAGLRCDAVLSDLRMPGMDGITLLGAVERLRPDLIGRAALVTGDAMGAETETARAGGRPLLEKPVSPEDLRALIHRLLG